MGGRCQGTSEESCQGLARKAAKDEKLLDQLLVGILSKQDKTRYTSFKALMFMAEERPELLCPHRDYFAHLLDSENNHSKYIAIYLIASLAAVDGDKRFEQIFDKYYGLLNDRSIIPAAHVAASSGKIVRVKPKLEPRITRKLLSTDRTQHKPGHKELIKSYAIDAFNEYFDQANDRERILEFVRKQLDSKSPTTRKKARKFLKKWAK